MAQYQTAVPAYGRNYKSKAAALADWHAGKDFRCEPQGCYVTKAEAAGLTVNLRYDRLTKVVAVPPEMR